MVIAIDGPAGSGKSSVARELARRLGFIYIDTGAMYRGVALLALREHAAREGVRDSPPALDDMAAVENRQALETLAAAVAPQFRFVAHNGENRLYAGEEDISNLIRTPEVAQGASVVSTVAGVREAMVERQREMGRDGNVVMEGRDIGTVVFPHAKVKVFLSASTEERARRRFAEAPHSGSIHEVASHIRERDTRDSEREIAPLRPAEDAVVIDSTGVEFEHVVEQILHLAQRVH